jgi:hypothetical protein
MDHVPDHTSGGTSGRDPESDALVGEVARTLPDDAAARHQPGPPSRGDRLRHALLLMWGAVMGAAVLAGIVGFLVHFLLLQR